MRWGPTSPSLKLNFPALSALVLAATSMPLARLMRMTWSPAAGLPVVPLVTVPVRIWASCAKARDAARNSILATNAIPVLWCGVVGEVAAVFKCAPCFAVLMTFGRLQILRSARDEILILGGRYLLKFARDNNWQFPATYEVCLCLQNGSCRRDYVLFETRNFGHDRGGFFFERSAQRLIVCVGNLAGFVFEIQVAQIFLSLIHI